MAKPLIKEINLSKDKLGLKSQSFKAVINRITRSIIATGDKKQVNQAIRLALRVNANQRISKNSLYDLIAFGSRVRDKKNTSRNIEILGGGGTINSFRGIQTNLRDSTIYKLMNVGVLNRKQANNLKKAIIKKKNRKVKKIDVDSQAIKDLFSIIENMGGLAIALDRYFERVKQLCENAGITVDELIDAY